MRPWKTSFFALALVVATTGFGFGEPLDGVIQLSSLAPDVEQEDPLLDLPFISSTFQQIERTNALPRIVSQGPALAPFNQIPLPPPRPVDLSSAPSEDTTAGLGTVRGGECPDCAPRLANLKYAQCSAKNSYLENSLQKALRQNGLLADLMKTGARGDTLIKPVCMKLGMESRFGVNNASFRTCEPGALKATRKVIRPCISEDYFALMNNSFDLVSRCMGPLLSNDKGEQNEEIRLLFGMLHIESGLHLNAQSPSGAAGIGQLTQDAISSINRSELPRLREQLEAQGGLCAQLSREMLKGKEPMKSSFRHSCERVSVEKGNPLLNLVYSFANVLQGKRIVNKDVLDHRRFKNRFNLSRADQDRLETSLAIWTHNTGPAGLKTPLMALLNSKYRGRRVGNVDQFLRELSQAMKSYPHSANRKTARRHETSNYYPFMQRTLSKLEKDAGGGSCLAR
ncbi:MAG: hypothetical protein KF802_05980 [Bdellovibrionaceae bacterium]|nr:hypothetical protein [Pseudobdellovibrionaceae bacterium]MBX3032468.1 hypothetical protein [Pseudobdellovibrionaceae bacterium]